MTEEASYIKKAIEDEEAIQVLKDALREEPNEVRVLFLNRIAGGFGHKK